MEGIAQAAASALADYECTHPEYSIDRVPGHYFAWKPVPGDTFAGELTHGYTEDELLAKLDSG